MTIELVSDLGGGKTTFVQGLAAGLGYAAPVTSPTFTIVNHYELPDGRSMHHYDLYRLGADEPVLPELAEDSKDSGVITVIEWPERAVWHVPADHLIIHFNVVDEATRRLRFTAGGPHAQAIIKELGR
jgi:tRNA threonylcarbamoyladenosine biosynthesis protein TsaE